MALILLIIDGLIIFFLARLSMNISKFSLIFNLFIYLIILVAVFTNLYIKSKRHNTVVQDYELDENLNKIIINNGIKIKDIFIIKDPTFNIYVDINKNIYISEKLLIFKNDLIDSLVLHEISHIVNSDIFVLNILAINSIYILIQSIYLAIIIKKIFIFILILISLFLFLVIKLNNIYKLNIRQEHRADEFVVNNGYKKELVEVLEYFLDYYRPVYSAEPNKNYYLLISRLNKLKEKTSSN